MVRDIGKLINGELEASLQSMSKTALVRKQTLRAADAAGASAAAQIDPRTASRPAVIPESDAAAEDTACAGAVSSAGGQYIES